MPAWWAQWLGSEVIYAETVILSGVMFLSYTEDSLSSMDTSVLVPTSMQQINLPDLKLYMNMSQVLTFLVWGYNEILKRVCSTLEEF